MEDGYDIDTVEHLAVSYSLYLDHMWVFIVIAICSKKVEQSFSLLQEKSVKERACLLSFIPSRILLLESALWLSQSLGHRPGRLSLWLSS